MTVFVTIGAPGSGKTTWAKHHCQHETSVPTAIVCRDDIRLTYGLKPGDREDFVTKVQRQQMEGAFLDGMNVIVADTNLNPKFRGQLIKFCHEHAQDVQTVVFDVRLDELIRRDQDRQASVGADVAARFHQQMQQQSPKSEFLPAPVFSQRPDHDPEKHDIVIVDIDGTIASHKGIRDPFDESKVSQDEPIPDVIKIVRALHTHAFDVVFASGRHDTCREDTAAWILKHLGIDVNDPKSGATLIMRKADDNRPDYMIKAEIYDDLMKRYNIIMSFDDRDQVVRHVRKRGITVAQVAPGRF